ncbi:amino acid adenylation domain-containing protein [Streptomyces sp. NPDC046887]|uniref:non-ribosomal peptide synthetase n=1 Tax=Streptomyces sp. NPDC046887 TaxID=3155472 RepID=UPI0033F71477
MNTEAAPPPVADRTALPSWTRAPRPGAAEHIEPLPAELTEALGRTARGLGVPPATVCFAAHLRVLAALSGSTEITTGYGAGVVRRVAVTAPDWRGLVRAAHRAAAESTPAAQPSDVVFDPVGTEAAAAGRAGLRVAVLGGERPYALRLRYRTELLDAPAAARIAGYHRTALALLTADPKAPQAGQSLVSAAEIRYQTEELAAGPHCPLPDLRAHQLFERQAAVRPDAVAVVHGERHWTFRELNVRANRLAHALLAEGLRPEDRVAVVRERDPEWMASALAVLKAGGAYLPVEPHFPAARIARMLERASCRLVLTGAGISPGLTEALADRPGTAMLDAEAVSAGPGAEADPGLPIGPGRLAYVYFTSGSTGEPKGAMCEHAGLLNHLLAKIRDLGVDAGQVVAQSAPQCFDISLWQLLAGPLTGGRTLLVEQAAVLDADRFLDTVERGGVTVLQVVPSYLDALLAALERHPRELPELRCVSVTGEALRPELVRRWFAARPGVPLVNAYGLTETSDDTHHEILHRPPPGDRIPLGRPLPNVRAYVVDERLRPVPLGAPGELVFSGVCVGRGYLGDPERTQAAFPDDPLDPGHRLYRSGDLGRWTPDGKLEFLGRRDGQVKVRGFRVETGEVENALLRVDGIRDAAVVVGRPPGGAARLVAFCAGPRPIADDRLRSQLARRLPEYLLPDAFHWRSALPLTANGKTDRKALAELDTTEAAASGPEAPRGPAEERLAAAWAEVLGVPVERVGRRDHFFSLGGDSLSAVRLAVRLDRSVSVSDITAHPVLADLAALLTDRSRDRSDSRQGVRR